MIGYLGVSGILALIILGMVLFARFLNWLDDREMDEAERNMHHVKRGALNSPYNSVEW